MATDTAHQDQKKRTMEALERRFALAEAELRLQQKKSKKRPGEEINKVALNTNSSSIDASVTQHSSNPLSKKDVQVNDPTYSQLSHPVHENLLTTNAKISNRQGTVVDQVLHDLLQKGDSAKKYMQGSRSMKIDNYILLDNFVQKSNASAGSHSRALRNLSRRSKKHMSMKQHKKCGSFNLSQELHKFEIFKPMHEMWTDYIAKLLKNVGKNQLAQCLLSADLHGALILVVQSKIAAFIGVSGIMIRETAKTFGIITQDNKFRGNTITSSKSYYIDCSVFAV
ncbi:unnamed protein product [Ilex paraguariensis]|uniref:Uncharacterized protein n=1 Tax=Ilex paraguariensis TaxID=185542 RepID=A0ABC8T632_9AQUA